MSTIGSESPCVACGKPGHHWCTTGPLTLSMSNETQLDRIERKLDELALDVSTLRLQHETSDYERLTRAFDTQLQRANGRRS